MDVNPLFKENDESVFEINVKAIKTLVDAAGEVDSVRRDQVSAAEKVAESLLMLREIPVPGLNEEGRDAMYRTVEILAVAVEENKKVT
ncbi:hypothetical protein C5167_037680 [Papaver somniferum]|uniref:Uncharacterized protein n=1 Tax=Papaver somniferum TaxID=3469 RepID=A0A4Y7IB39_PAPSO|nr:hypothetical protein C5167_037680 [Papaver somniferum]